MVKIVPAMTTQMTSQGMKAGAIDEMFKNYTCPHIGIIHRGGFESTEYESTAYRYSQMKVGVTDAGRAMNGWNNCQVQVPTPSCDAVTTPVSSVFASSFF